MTPEQKIKHLILIRNAEIGDKELPTDITSENIDDLYSNIDEPWDDIYAIRAGEVETNLPTECSRHYESKSVAAKAPDGSWVGWTYWYGGGKHGDPESIDWMDSAYDLSVTEEEKLVIVRTFKKI